MRNGKALAVGAIGAIGVGRRRKRERERERGREREREREERERERGRREGSALDGVGRMASAVGAPSRPPA